MRNVPGEIRLSKKIRNSDGWRIFLRSLYQHFTHLYSSGILSAYLPSIPTVLLNDQCAIIRDCRYLSFPFIFLSTGYQALSTYYPTANTSCLISRRCRALFPVIAILSYLALYVGFLLIHAEPIKADHFRRLARRLRPIMRPLLPATVCCGYCDYTYDARSISQVCLCGKPDECEHTADSQLVLSDHVFSSLSFHRGISPVFPESRLAYPGAGNSSISFWSGGNPASRCRPLRCAHLFSL